MGGFELKIIKRSQLALLSLSFMIMIAGYINYKYDPDREKNLGQTVHVNSGDVFLYENTGVANNATVSVYAEESRNNDTIYNNKKSSSVISTFKSQREDMFSELEETYNAAITSDIDTATKEKYQEKIDELVSKKHLIGIVENLIQSKGIQDIAILPTGDNINVVVSLEQKLTNSQVALIQKIIQDEFKIDASKITITQESIVTE